ncbi:MAG: PspA/IM30 family protein [Idiomarina sp.]|nr:PspA/IM30 family protein [Idiomarina sp.]
MNINPHSYKLEQIRNKLSDLRSALNIAEGDNTRNSHMLHIYNDNHTGRYTWKSDMLRLRLIESRMRILELSPNITPRSSLRELESHAIDAIQILEGKGNRSLFNIGISIIKTAVPASKEAYTLAKRRLSKDNNNPEHRDKTDYLSEAINLKKKYVYNAIVTKTARELSSSIALLERDLMSTKTKHDKVEKAIEPLKKQIRQLDQRISKARLDLDFAKSLAEEIDSAQTNFAREHAIQKCRRKFGEDDPTQAIYKNSKTIDALERNREKMVTKAMKDAEIASKEINKLILDGNNLCYDARGFIGLSALSALLPALSKKFDVTVVFDASIAKNTNETRSNIVRKFGSSIETHIVNAGVDADNILLQLAGTDESCWVVSNDRFVEYSDYPAVKDGRIISHEILGGMAIIPDLGVSTSYSSH